MPFGTRGGSSTTRGGGTGVAPGTTRPARNRHKTRPAGRAAEGATSAGQPSAERLADLLEGRPLASCRDREPKADPLELLRCGEISDVRKGDLPAPEVPGESLLRRQSALGESAIPLAPCRLLGVSEVKGVDHLAPLPTRISGWVRLVVGVSSRRDLAPPYTADGRALDVHRQLTGIPSRLDRTRRTWR